MHKDGEKMIFEGEDDMGTLRYIAELIRGAHLVEIESYEERLRQNEVARQQGAIPFPVPALRAELMVARDIYALPPWHRLISCGA